MTPLLKPIDAYSDLELRIAWRIVKDDLMRLREMASPESIVLLTAIEAEIIRRFIAQEDL